VTRRYRTLLIVGVLLVVGWCLLRTGQRVPLPWNQGQAGSIFQPGLKMGGGQ
jgi:hypothetical protein